MIRVLNLIIKMNLFTGQTQNVESDEDELAIAMGDRDYIENRRANRARQENQPNDPEEVIKQQIEKYLSGKWQSRYSKGVIVFCV